MESEDKILIDNKYASCRALSGIVENWGVNQILLPLRSCLKKSCFGTSHF